MAKEKLEERVEELTNRLGLEKKLRVNSWSWVQLNYCRYGATALTYVGTAGCIRIDIETIGHVCVFDLQTDLEKSKVAEVSKLQAALNEMEQRMQDVTAMQERESAKKVVEEALEQEREKISSLTSEIEGLKVHWTTREGLY